MFVFAVFGLLAGGWIVDSAVHNRNPLTSALDVIRDPGNARQIVASSGGSAFTVQRNAPTADAAAAGNTTGLDPNADNGVNGTTVTASPVTVGILAFARRQIGKPYVWGGTGDNNSKGGFDCSGLVFKAFQSVGVTVPRTTATLLAAAKLGKQFKTVSKSELMVGDLVFPDLGHVQIYSGGGKVVEAPRAGLNVREVNMWGFLTAMRYQGVKGLNANASGSGM